MRVELRYGKVKYLSFIFLDIICLIAANNIAAALYLNRMYPNYSFADYRSIIGIMIFVDILVTISMNTLCRVLRRRKRKEMKEGFKHIVASFVILAVILFSLRKGPAYSRVTVFLAYGIYYVLFVGTHIVWKMILRTFHRKVDYKTALLMTTDRFVDEGMRQLKELNVDVEYIYLLKNLDRDNIAGVPVVKRWEEVGAAICWHELDKVYIYGLDHQMVPQYILSACEDMKVKFDLVDFNYRIIDIATVKHEDPKFGELSFLEGKRDIPFPIRRVYWITETEAQSQRGFHAHKLNCQLLYCPFGVIDIILDDGKQRTTVTLDEPSKGLLLMPGLWREMIWKQSGSVLCVLASEYYDADEYIRDYDKFIEYNKKYREDADPIAKHIYNTIEVKYDEGTIRKLSSDGNGFEQRIEGSV